MKRKSLLLFGAGFLFTIASTFGMLPAIGRFVQQDGPPGFGQGPPGFGPPGFGPPGGQRGRGGPGGPGAKDIELVDQFDANEDGWLNAEERENAKEKLAAQPAQGRRGGRGPGGFGGRGGEVKKAEPGIFLKPGDVEQYSKEALYDSDILRTIFIDFEDVRDWHSELTTFKPTDVELPATVTVDGKVYPKVGVKYRGNSSYMMVPEGYKKSLNLSFDMANQDQSLLGYRTLNLLNCAGDSSLLSSAIYSQIASSHMAVPKANMVRVVINGESWGLYANVQQFNKDFLKEMYGQSKGARWKVPGRPGGDGGLRYVGDNIADYKSRYEIKSKDRDEDWQALIHLCKVIDQTPSEQLPAKLAPLMDIDQLLWFLAADLASVNSDGYWTRASDYNIYLDQSGKFHISPYDMNEAFMTAQHGPPGGRGPGGPLGFGPGGGFGIPGFGPPPEGFQPPRAPGQQRQEANGRTAQTREPRQGPARQGQRDQRRQRGRRGGSRGPGGPGGGPGGHGSVDLDPLVGFKDANKPLHSKILAVPQWRQQYLANIKTLAEKEFDWETIGPFIEAYRQLLAEDVKRDTRRQSPAEAFFSAIGGEGDNSLKTFFNKRREFLLSLPAIQQVKVESKPSIRRVESKTDNRQLVQSLSAELVINEIYARPVEGEPAGQDWIELLNNSDQAIELSGFSLSDSEEQATKWTFPESTKIEANGYLVIWADGRGRSDELHANFKLSKKGESVLLTHAVDNEIHVIDRVDFPTQSPGKSFGRFPNATGPWKAMTPTPGKHNQE